MREREIILKSAITLNGTPVTRIMMREPTVGTEEDAMTLAISLGKERNPISAEMCTMGLLTGVPYDVIRQMSVLDYQKLRTAYDFLTRPTVEGQPESELTHGTPPTNCTPSDTAS